jgi:glycosyltransferase involved in cell wall biosynthesis
MYIGVPVIGSMAPGIAESIGSDGDRGFLIGEKDDIISITEKINRCVEGGEKIEQMKKQAREYVETQMKNNLSINDIL